MRIVVNAKLSHIPSVRFKVPRPNDEVDHDPPAEWILALQLLCARNLETNLRNSSRVDRRK